MILLDVNVVVAAHRDDHPHHVPARSCLDTVVAGDGPFTVPEEVWAAAVRIATNRRIFTVPTPVDDVFAYVEAVRSQAGYTRVTPGSQRMAIFERLCREAAATGDLVADAWLAALAIERGCTLVSFDRDFARFDDLRWRRPEQVASG